MTRVALSAFAVIVAIMGAAAPFAHADTPPSRWERAKDPALGDDWRLHVAAQRILSDVPIAKEAHRFDIADALSLRVKTALESAGAEASKDIRLRLDLAEALDERKDYARAIALYRSALALSPDHPATEQGWLMLGIACGHVGDNECEQKAYLETLKRRTEDHRRTLPMLNLAETEMHLGNLKDAIADYQETLRIAARLPAGTTTPLALWGLAVALDRSGDRAGAEAQAHRAVEHARSLHRDHLLREDGVFFYPEYERDWYEALGAIARARDASTAREAAVCWAEAEAKFAGYVRGAETTKDRWLPIAKARLASVRAERQKAEKRAAKEPARKGEQEDLNL
jgi:tetratricopeptide (TPR) repeat protein